MAENISYLYQPNDWLMESVGGVHDATYTYNPRGFLTELVNSSQAINTAGQKISDNTMLYDAAGNRTQMGVHFYPQGSAPDLSRTVTYGYDSRDELTGENSSSADRPRPTTPTASFTTTRSTPRRSAGSARAGATRTTS